jgi:hypothetical protein
MENNSKETKKGNGLLAPIIIVVGLVAAMVLLKLFI